MARQQRTVDVNQADVPDLSAIEGISEERARLIVEFRNEHGPFKRLEDLTDVPGIGASTYQKIRGRLSISEESQATERAEAAGEEVEEEEVGADLEIEALRALAQLDLEAAAGYRMAGEMIEHKELRDTLQRFEKDHTRHVESLNELIGEMGGEAMNMIPDPEISILLVLTDAMSAMGNDGALYAMVGNEHLTNATYESALALISEPEARSVIEKNREDERRHLKTLEKFMAQSN